MTSYSTKNCIAHPTRRAVMFTGHVHLGKEDITAGWCQECKKASKPTLLFSDQRICGGISRRGCCGEYHLEYGLDEESTT